ncbi:hypothetical protein F5Y14DRAFT_143290 [Nemania sp. NC0429]|nr:hypothetical protein F5Y14DRAFT_143290 [Nemania sp. NC0429]
MQLAPNLKSTPNRRRPPTGRNRSGSQKVYASENDVPSYKSDTVVAPTTPKKNSPNGAAVPRTQSTNQKQKNKGNKNRNAKNGVASPGQRQDRESPSLQPQTTPAPIFAGSTFHASPAPSALPLPSFLLGLSSADSPSIKPKTTELADDSSLTDSDEGSPADDPVPRNDDSPLEFFFRAQRAEKARVRRASSANTDAISTATLSPPQFSFKECNTLPKTMAHNPLRRPPLTGSATSPNMPTHQLDGGPVLPVGPAFSTPYQERIRAARSNQNASRPTPTANHNLDPNSSEALKRYLFTGHLERFGPHESSPYSSPSSQLHQVAPTQQKPGMVWQQGAHQASLQSPPPIPNLARGVFPASVLTNHTPRQPTASNHIDAEPSPQSERILALEGSLRRVLKLDSLG